MSKKSKKTAIVLPLERTLIQPTPGRKAHFEMILWYMAIGVFAFIVYANTLGHDYALDDLHVILTSQQIQAGVQGIGEIWTHPQWYQGRGIRPLPATIFAIVKEMCGNNPHIGHWINVLLFSFTNVLLFLLLFKAFNLPIIQSLLTVSLFVLHPIHTEVVANIKSLDEILCLLFLIITAICTIKYLNSERGWFLIVGGICFLFALLSKETALPFLFVIPLFAHYFTKCTSKKIFLAWLPFIGVVIGYLAYYFVVNNGPVNMAEDSILNNSISAAPTLLSRYATAIKILGKYLLLLLIPHPLIYDYGYNQIPNVSFSDPLALLSLLIYAGLIIYAIRHFKSRAPLSFAIIFYVCMMGMTSNILFLIGSTMGERFLYTPSVGYCLAAGILIQESLERFSSKKKIIYGGLFVLMAFFAIKTTARNTNWKDNLTLFSHDVADAPNSAVVHASLGNMLIITAQDKTPQQARVYFENAKTVLLRSVSLYPGYGFATGNLALAYSSLNQTDSALTWFKQTLKLDPRDEVAKLNLGDIYLSRNQFDTAAVWFRSALALDMSNIETRMRLAKALTLGREFDSALVQLNYVNKQRNGDPNIINLIGIIEAQKHKKYEDNVQN